MQILRTPDECFEGIPDFPYEPRYADVPDQDGGTLRMAYLDEGVDEGHGVRRGGTGEAPVGLLLHGEPSWSFLYRHVLRVLGDAGLRGVPPALVGFCRSDKTPQN